MGTGPIADVEQNMFPAALQGVDLCDLHAAIAPRPLLAMIENIRRASTRRPSISASATSNSARPTNSRPYEASDPHAWTVKLRLAATDWLSRWFYGRPGPDREPEFEPENPKTLY